MTGKKEAEGKGEPKGQVLVPVIAGEAGMNPHCNICQQEKTLPSDKHILARNRYVQRGGRNSVPLDYQIINFFPEIIDCEKEENKRFSLVTHWRAPTTESTVVGLVLIPPTSKSADS